MDIKKTYEALDWLKNNSNPSAFAGNRFGDTISAMDFVEELYELGALKVSIIGVSDEPWRIQEEGGPYADILLVELPNDIEIRDRILDVYKKELQIDELNEDEVFEENNILEFWWD